MEAYQEIDKSVPVLTNSVTYFSCFFKAIKFQKLYPS